MRRLVLLLLVAVSVPSYADTYTQTRNPVVLVHGFMGFDSLLGIVDYFHGIPGALRDGGARVYVVDVSAAGSTVTRGEQLIAQLDTLRALYRHERFNLIGHSQGGPTTRYVASVRPDLVASVTSIAGVHQGSAVADGLVNSPASGLAKGVVGATATLVGALSGSARPQDSVAALSSLTSSSARDFNARHPQGQPTTSCGQGPELVNGIRYFSIGGNSTFTNVFDVGDTFLSATGLFFGGVDNDGMVSRCGQHWGTVVRDDYGWNHMDEVNQILGIRGLFSASPSSVYRAQVNRLKNLGL